MSLILAMIGLMAPNFTFNSNQKTINFHDYVKNKEYTVLVFYPKDNSPGCTIQLKKYRDLANEFNKVNTQIVAVSTDSEESHENFANKKELLFQMVSDQDGSISKAYNSFKEINLLVKKIPTSQRSTFIINKQGIVVAAYEDVSVFSDAQNCLNEIQKLITEKKS
jgi:peroxiredoxin Q/BCP